MTLEILYAENKHTDLFCKLLWITDYCDYILGGRLCINTHLFMGDHLTI